MSEVEASSGEDVPSSPRRRQPWEPERMSPQQKQLFDEVWALVTAFPGIQEKAEGAGWKLNESLVVKYCDAAGWAPREAQQIAKTIEEVLRWRCDYQVCNMDAASFAGVAKRMPVVLWGRDLEGRPVLYVDFYRAKQENSDHMLRYLIFHMERANSAYEANPDAEHRLNIIVDCSGKLGRHDIPEEERGGVSSASAKDLSQVLQLYYAQSMGQCTVLGAPFTVTTMYNAIKYILPESTRSKVKFESYGSARTVLTKTVAPEELLDIIGGDQKAEGFDFEKYLYQYDPLLCKIAATSVYLSVDSEERPTLSKDGTIYFSTTDLERKLQPQAASGAESAQTKSSRPQERPLSFAATKEGATKAVNSIVNSFSTFAKELTSASSELKRDVDGATSKVRNIELSKMAGRVKRFEFLPSSLQKGLFSPRDKIQGERSHVEGEDEFYDCWQEPPPVAGSLAAPAETEESCSIQ